MKTRISLLLRDPHPALDSSAESPSA